MRSLVDVLKDKCHSKEELICILRDNFRNKSREALRKRCERYLRKLEGLGLVEKRGDKYCWYTYENLFKDREDYSAKLVHSRQLIPALRKIAGILLSGYSMGQEEYVSPEDMALFVNGAKEHLRAYPKLLGLLNSRDQMEKKAKQERQRFKGYLMEKLRKEFEKEPVVDPVQGFKLPSFVGSTFPLLICRHILYGSPIDLKLEGEKIWFGSRLVAKGSHLLSNMRKFKKSESEDEFNIEAARRVGKLEEKAREAQRRFRQEIRKLILRIESGEPLLGGCEICPKIYFSASLP